jgi:hypothetical protein
MKIEFFDIFSKSSQISDFIKSVQWESSCPDDKTDGQG